jgi:hypothetical protein
VVGLDHAVVSGLLLRHAVNAIQIPLAVRLERPVTPGYRFDGCDVVRTDEDALDELAVAVVPGLSVRGST